ncbi:MAG: F-box protein [Kistimonas sp.]|nr:F-box protein [Kistimonas sp.]
MINRLADSGPEHRHSPSTQTSSQPGKTQQPGAGRQAFDRPLSAAFADRPEPLPRQQILLSEDQDNTDTPGLPQNLPILVLNKIFGQLPSRSLGRCAQVCRHWQAWLPSLQDRLTQWQKEDTPPSCLASPHLGQGFNSRTLPFLQAANSPFLPPLTHLQQAQPQDTRQLSQPATVCDLLPRLVHAALNQNLTQAHQLRLHPTSLDWPQGAVTGTGEFAFSPCSRWLAIACSPWQEAPGQ